jgi:glycosyltransferase involved in cell wall biosynthesis
MPATDSLRRVGMWLRAINTPRRISPVPRVLVVSNVGSFGGGGAVGFRDVVLALREKRPDWDVVGVYPWKGNLAADCAQQGVRTKIAWVPGWAFLERWRWPGIEALIGALPRAVLVLPGLVQAVVHLARLRPTMVLTNTMIIPSHAVAAKLLGIPHYWVVREFGRDDHRLRFLLGYRRTIRLVGRLSESVICNSHAVEKSLLGVDPKMRTRVIYPVVDTPISAPPKRQPGERMRVVLVGRFSQSKGQHLAIEAVAVARKAGVDIELALVGSGNDRALRKLSQQLGVEDLVNIHEPTPDLRRHWSAAHVGLMCSECEAFGRVTVEAMRGGLPVCGTDSGGTPEIIGPGINGLLSPAGDADALAANLMTLESDEDLRRKLACRAAETTRRFERDHYGDELAPIVGLG